MFAYPDLFFADGFRRGFISSLNPFLDYSSMFQPSQFVNALRWCHTPDTFVETNDRNIIPIKDVQTGYKLATHDGSEGVVTNVICHSYSGPIIKIDTFGSVPLKVTADHVLFVSDEKGNIVKKKACEVKVGEYLVSFRTKGDLSTDDLLHEILSSEYFDFSDNGLYKLCVNSSSIESLKKGINDLYKIHRKCEDLGICSKYTIYQLEVITSCSSPNKDKSNNLFFSENLVFRRILSVCQYSYEGKVYSLTIDPNNSYIANGVACCNCEYIVMSNGILRAAIDRIVSFFITYVEVSGGDLEHRKKAEEFLNDHLGINSLLRLIAFDYLTYGNFFVSLETPFVRRIQCETCKYVGIIDNLIDKVSTDLAIDEEKNDQITVSCLCPVCNTNSRFVFLPDTVGRKEEDYRIKRWNVYDIKLVEYDEYSGKLDIVWDIPERYRTEVLKGNKNSIRYLKSEILASILKRQDIKFNPDYIYHGKEETLCGITLRGWGLPRVFSTLRHAWLVQVLHRVNEAVGMDYIIPLRIITPVPRTGGEAGDIMHVANFGNFASSMSVILDQRRRDPLMWHVSPWPIDYKSLGGDGRVFTPHDIYQQSLDVLLNSFNIPVELYKGSVQVHAAPLALRIMETSWGHIVHTMNSFLMWLKNKLVTHLDWDSKLIIKLAKPSHIDDIERQSLKTQLMLSGQMSKELALQSLGIDFKENLRRQLEEEVIVARESMEAQKKMMNIGLGDQMAASSPAGPISQSGGMPSDQSIPVSGGVPTAQPAGDPVMQIMANLPAMNLQSMSPQDLDKLAGQLALQIYGLPESQKDSALRQLKIKNEMLWMVVKEKINDMVASARRKGITDLQQQAAMTNASTVNPPM